MNAQQERVLQSFRRVQGWFAANPQYTASTPALATQLDALNGIVQRLTDHSATQETQRSNALLDSKDEVEKRREVEVHHMKPIAQVARALRGVVPGIGVLKLPKGSVPTPQVITAATAMMKKSEVYKDVLVENGLPANFLEELEGDGSAQGQPRRSRARASGEGSSNTWGAERAHAGAAYGDDHGCDRDAPDPLAADEAGRVGAVEARDGARNCCARLDRTRRELLDRG